MGDHGAAGTGVQSGHAGGTAAEEGTPQDAVHSEPDQDCPKAGTEDIRVCKSPLMV